MSELIERGGHLCRKKKSGPLQRTPSNEREVNGPLFDFCDAQLPISFA